MRKTKFLDFVLSGIFSAVGTIVLLVIGLVIRGSLDFGPLDFCLALLIVGQLAYAIGVLTLVVVRTKWGAPIKLGFFGLALGTLAAIDLISGFVLIGEIPSVSTAAAISLYSAMAGMVLGATVGYASDSIKLCKAKKYAHAGRMMGILLGFLLGQFLWFTGNIEDPFVILPLATAALIAGLASLGDTMGHIAEKDKSKPWTCLFASTILSWVTTGPLIVWLGREFDLVPLPTLLVGGATSFALYNWVYRKIFN